MGEEHHIVIVLECVFERERVIDSDFLFGFFLLSVALINLV
jgi:hypothetical protein